MNVAGLQSVRTLIDKIRLLKPREIRNQDGGPKTAVFAFSLEREREIASRISGDAPKFLAAQYRLIDAVQEYRQSGIPTAELYQACLAELELSPRSYSNLDVASVGMKRLAELAADGHEAAANLVRIDFAHRRAERRMTAYQWALRVWLGRPQRLSVCKEMLGDPSGDVRQIAAQQIECDGFLELAESVELAAQGSIGARAKANMRHSAFALRERFRLGLPARAPLPDESWRKFYDDEAQIDRNQRREVGRAVRE